MEKSSDDMTFYEYVGFCLQALDVTIQVGLGRIVALY